MYHMKKNNETFPLDEKELEGLVLRRVAALYDDKLEIGQVLQIEWGARYVAGSPELQAEFYYQALPSDVFFEKGLVHRKNVFEPLQLEKQLGVKNFLEGIVLTHGTGIILTDLQNQLLIRPEHFAEIREILAYQENHREEFAAYYPSGHSMCGFLGYSYQPPGSDCTKRQFIEKEKTKAIKKEKRQVLDDEKQVVVEYWNSEKVSLTIPFGSGQAKVGRYTLQFSHYVVQPPKNRTALGGKTYGEGVHLWHIQIPALKKILEIYQNKK